MTFLAESFSFHYFVGIYRKGRDREVAPTEEGLILKS